MERLKYYWRKAILEKVPHGEESSLGLCEEDAISLCKILLKNGYAVCLTGGDLEDEVRVS